MKAIALNANPAANDFAKVVLTTSELSLRELFRGYDAWRVEASARDLRRVQASRWTGSDLSLAPSVAIRTGPDGAETVATINDLVRDGTLAWDGDQLAFVSTDKDPNVIYTIVSDEAELVIALDHDDIPSEVRSAMESRQQVQKRDLDKIATSVRLAIGNHIESLRAKAYQGRQGELNRTTTPRTPRGVFVLRPAERPLKGAAADDELTVQRPPKNAAADDVLTVSNLECDGRTMIVVRHRSGDDDCSVTLKLPPSPELVPPTVTIEVDGRPITPVEAIDDFGHGRLRYLDIKDVLEGTAAMTLSMG